MNDFALSAAGPNVECLGSGGGPISGPDRSLPLASSQASNEIVPMRG
jgi:hypothetical protein